MKEQIFGSVEISLVDATTRRVVARSPWRKNMFTYEGADVLGKILVGKTEFIPNAVYVEFQNGGSPTPPALTRADGRSYYAGLEVSGPVADRSYMRLPLLVTPQLATSDADKYQSNVTRWMFMTEGGTQDVTETLTFSSGAGSIVYGFALVAAPDFLGDRSRDLVFARFYPDTPIEKTAGVEIQARWNYSFM